MVLFPHKRFEFVMCCQCNQTIKAFEACLFIHDTQRLHESPTSVNIIVYIYDNRVIFNTTHDHKEGDNSDLSSRHLYNLKSSITN